MDRRRNNLEIMKKFFSRKLLVFVMASVGLYFNVIDAYTWLVVSGIYIGVQGINDIIKVILENRK